MHSNIEIGCLGHVMPETLANVSRVCNIPKRTVKLLFKQAAQIAISCSQVDLDSQGIQCSFLRTVGLICSTNVAVCYLICIYSLPGFQLFYSYLLLIPPEIKLLVSCNLHLSPLYFAFKIYKTLSIDIVIYSDSNIANSFFIIIIIKTHQG